MRLVLLTLGLSACVFSALEHEPKHKTIRGARSTEGLPVVPRIAAL
jgi:hypothetical protein